MHTLGRKIASARIAAGLTTEQLGAACGDVTAAAVYKWETDKALPRLDKLQLIAAATGKPVSYFLPDADVQPTAFDGLTERPLAIIADQLAEAVEVLRRQPDAPTAEPNAATAIRHPGVEALLANDAQRQALGVTDREAADLRSLYLGPGRRVDEPDDAVQFLLILRRLQRPE